jgi:hypothetical protein
MSVTGNYYDLGASEPIKDFILRDSGDVIAFDIKHSDGYFYAVTLKRRQGTLFKGTATSQPGSETATLTCRIFEDIEEGIMVIAGSGWQYAFKPDNYRWYVELQRG